MATDYTITNQRQTTELTAAGQFRDVIEVSFQTKDGDVGTVTVPVSDHNAENIAQIVGARAAQFIAVRKL